MTAETLGYALVSLALALAFGPFWLRFLRAQRMGKQTNPSEGEEQKEREGTPTMGGVVFLIPILAVTLAFQVIGTGRMLMLLPVLFALALAFLGGIDDRQTLVGRQRSAGLHPAIKWGAQLVLCLAASAALAWYGVTQIHVPFIGDFDLPLWVYVPFATFVLLATTNSV